MERAIAANGVSLFNQPSGVAAGLRGTVFVVDSQNSRLVEFTPDWKVLQSWPIAVTDTQHSPRALPLSNGNVLVSNPRDGQLLLFGNGFEAPRAFNIPAGSASVPLGVTKGRHGEVLVTCYGTNQVLEFRLPGVS
jgi:hypothetical protein